MVKIQSAIQLLVVDIDDTLVDDTGYFSPLVKQAIQSVKMQGIQVAIATSRHYQSALRIQRELGLTLPLISFGGAFMQTPHRRTTHLHWPMAATLAAEVLHQVDHPDWQDHISVHIHVEDQFYIWGSTSKTEEYLSRFGVNVVHIQDWRSLLPLSPTRLLLLSDDAGRITQLYHHWQQRYVPEQLSLELFKPTYLDIMHPKVHKGVAVKYLAETILGLQANQVMAIGDGFNDLEMLHYAGLGIAMGNAPEPVQAIADWIAPSIEDDGVAVAIQTWLTGVS